MKKITVAFLMALVICIFCIPTKTYASSGIMISDELDDLEGDGKYVIDADTCIDCGTCAATCPTGAIEG
mgnify:CR=1 FL=1